MRSIYLNQPAGDARAAVVEDLALWGGTVNDGDVITLELPDGTRLAAAFQPVDAGSTGVHFVACGAGASTEGLHDLARRVVQLRHRIEMN